MSRRAWARLPRAAMWPTRCVPRPCSLMRPAFAAVSAERCFAPSKRIACAAGDVARAARASACRAFFVIAFTGVADTFAFLATACLATAFFAGLAADFGAETASATYAFRSESRFSNRSTAPAKSSCLCCVRALPAPAPVEALPPR